MNVLETIKQEHQEVGALLDQADACEPNDERLYDLARQIEAMLSEHLAIEERLLYAKLRERADEQSEQVGVFEAYAEHAAAKALMTMLNNGRKPDEKFKAELLVLGENVKHHLQEEESKIFAMAREYLDTDELDDIGVAWQKAKARRAIRGVTAASRKRARR